jgi:hypothetical protein
MVRLAADAVQTLVAVAEALNEAREDWWLIGGAAVALHGLAIDVADVDVLVSPRDMHGLIAKLGVVAEQGVPVDKVRSDIWARWTALPLVVDLMAGLHVRHGETWTRVAPETRQAVTVDGHALYVPSRAELVDILRLFGRPKDLERARRLAEMA